MTVTAKQGERLLKEYKFRWMTLTWGWLNTQLRPWYLFLLSLSPLINSHLCFPSEDSRKAGHTSPGCCGGQNFCSALGIYLLVIIEINQWMIIAKKARPWRPRGGTCFRDSFHQSLTCLQWFLLAYLKGTNSNTK